MRFLLSGRMKLPNGPLGSASVDKGWTKNGNPKNLVSQFLFSLFLKEQSIQLLGKEMWYSGKAEALGSNPSPNPRMKNESKK